MENIREENNTHEKLIRRYKAKLLPYSYNIVGDFMEAEDVVQEVLNKYLLGFQEHVDKPDNYLTRAVINKSINRKELLRNKREQYRGEWLPTPVYSADLIYSKADKTEILNYSLLVLLERLNPKERAVFILKETFDYQHNEIGEILEIEPENSRQLLKRAKQKLGPHQKKSFAARPENMNFLHQLTDAIQNADLVALEKILSESIQTISDGGNKVSAARNVLTGRARVCKLLQAIYSKYLQPETEVRFTRLNHNPAILYIRHNIVYRCLIIATDKDEIETIFIIVNPDKLAQLNFSVPGF